MTKPFIYIISFCLCSISGTLLNAQDKIVEGEGIVLEDDPFKTKPVYELEAYRLAVNNAIEKSFGSSVLSNYERLTETQMKGQSVAMHSDIRNNYTNTFPNGEWIKTLSKECKEIKDESGNYWMSCSVKGHASKIETAEVQFIAKTFDGTDVKKNETIDFVNGESGYLYFKSARSGYLVVFFDDMKNVQRCVPYNTMNETELKIEANKEYIFFSKHYADYVSDKNLVNEVEFYTKQPLEYNQFYVLFSPEPFSAYFLDASEELGDGYKSFRSMEKDSFHRWLQENRVRNKNIQVQVIGISVKNPGRL
ncbi:MAG: hypothetical protein JXB49_34135 [Bacteroidales bacterium]|nr:hypothetical protein [Bacteroidales bacterium]